jgi:very-short-patch-repair endonuclease
MVTAQFKNLRTDSLRAKELRKSGPLPERLLWNALSKIKAETGLKFRRQQPLHPYIADFACMSARLIIELDGPSHDGAQAYDAQRSDELEKMDWTVLRFTNEEVLKNLEGVVAVIISKTTELVEARQISLALP